MTFAGSKGKDGYIEYENTERLTSKQFLTSITVTSKKDSLTVDHFGTIRKSLITG